MLENAQQDKILTLVRILNSTYHKFNAKMNSVIRIKTFELFQHQIENIFVDVFSYLAVTGTLLLQYKGCLRF